MGVAIAKKEHYLTFVFGLPTGDSRMPTTRVPDFELPYTHHNSCKILVKDAPESCTTTTYMICNQSPSLQR
jgi:hypothetical protein